MMQMATGLLLEVIMLNYMEFLVLVQDQGGNGRMLLTNQEILDL